MMGNNDKCVPIPSVFDRTDDPKRVQRKTWTFTESEMGTTDLHNRRMTLPMGNDDDSFSVRSHEMLHAALTPYDVRPDLQGNANFLAAEDGRIESIARSRGVTRPKGSISPDLVASLLASGNAAGAMQCGIACLGSPNEPDQRETLAKLGSPEANEILSLMDWAASVYAFDESVESAYQVADKLREILGEAPKSQPESQQGEPDKDQGEPEPESEPEDESDEESSDSEACDSPSRTANEGNDDSEPEPEPEPSEDEPEPENGQGEPEDEPEPESEPDEGEDDGQGSQGDSEPEPESEPEDNEGNDDGQGEPDSEPEPESGQGNGDSEPDPQENSGQPEPEATHLSAMAETGHHGAGSEGPMLHGVKIPRESAVVKTKGTGGIKRQIDKSAQEGRPKSVVPVDFDEMAKWMPMCDGTSSRHGKWGQVEIQYPKRPVIISQKMRGHKASKATDYGSVPTRMHRLPVDSKVFKSKRHTRQGTVLVDLSGSMSLSVDEIRELIEFAPAAVIAGYAGQYGHGRIRILAADGKMVEDDQLDLTYGGNTIDGPAIAWLAQQRGPRVLVTDGMMVDGNDDIMVLPIEGSTEQEQLKETIPQWFETNPQVEQVVRITQKARMTIVLNPADAKKHLR